MPPLLYLDTARLGQMTPAAKDAQLDFVRLSAEEPSSLYFEQFLRDGFCAWPSSYQQRFPGLRTWTGVSGLKNSIRRLVNAPLDWPVLLASRSLTLVELGARCLFRVCRNVLTTDLSWPSYQLAIKQRASATGNRVTNLALREGILEQGWTARQVASSLADAFVANHCDGLFLPAVDHLGIRIPIRDIVQRIQEVSELRFTLIDAAQAFCHVPLDECLESADFIVAGSHKWMRAYLPTGIGLFGQRRSREMIQDRWNSLRPTGRASDPLLHFTEQLDGGNLDGNSETANLASLFACAGAATDQLAAPCPPATERLPQIGHVVKVAPKFAGTWKPVLPHEAMRSRITLFEPSDQATCSRSEGSARQEWLAAGCIVSAYPGGRVRVSVAPAMQS